MSHLADRSARWYAIRTRSRHEQVVRTQLVNRNIEAFLPTFPRWSRWKDRRKRIHWPLFPGYCFARFDLTVQLHVLKCTGVLSVLSSEGKPAPIPDHELESLRLFIAQDIECDPCPFIREGAFVRIVHGPMQGVVGRLLRKDVARATVMLSVDVIGQAVRVVVDAADIALE